MNKYILIFLMASVTIYSQKIPKVHFNHIYCVLDSADYQAVCTSEFVNDSLCAHFTKPDSKGTYLFDPSSFLELLTSRREKIHGFTGIAFSIDKIGDLKILQNVLSQADKSENGTPNSTLDIQEHPPFLGLSVVSDSVFHAQSRIYVWFMEYKKEYFEQNNFRIDDSLLTRENFLEKYTSQGTGKILKKLTGIVIKLDSAEKEYLTGIFESIGYHEINENHFATPDNFNILLKERLPDDQKALESVEFECSQNYSEETTYRISDNISIILDGYSGRLVFY